jgi:alpha-L-fucosidase
MKQNFTAFVDEYMQVQLKDLINRYEPDLIWSDGDWVANSGQWKSKDFLAWLYTNSTVKDKVVVNGRWGTDMDWKKGPFVGNYIAFEFDGGDADATRPWEECRGVGISFGYNQNEDAVDINTILVLLLNLVDRVTLGGNLLLGIGADSTGKIPVIHQEKLLAMGAWLKINGEAIYGTRKGGYQISPNGTLQDPFQYKKDHGLMYVPGSFVLKQTLEPEPGYAVK